MNTENNTKIYEYYYFLLCFIIAYENNLLNIQNIDNELNSYIQKMSDINVNNGLSSTNKLYGDLILDLEGIVISGVGFNEMRRDYKDFIAAFGN